MLTIAPPLLEWFLHLSFLHQSLSVNKCEFRVAAEFVNCAAADWGLPLFANSTAAGTRRQLTPERQRLPRQQPNSEGNAESWPCSRMIKPKDFYAAKIFFWVFQILWFMWELHRPHQQAAAGLRLLLKRRTLTNWQGRPWSNWSDFLLSNTLFPCITLPLH